MRRSLIASALAVAVLGLNACTDKNAVDQASGGNTRFVTSTDGISRAKPSDRHSVLSFSGMSLDGQSLSIAAYRGKVIVLNIWGAWCGPCHAEAASLSEAATDLGNTATFLGVDVKDNIPAAKAFDRTYKINYPSFFDHAQKIPASIRALPPTAIPSTLVLDRQGRVAVRFARPVLYSELVTEVRAVAAETP